MVWKKIVLGKGNEMNKQKIDRRIDVDFSPAWLS